MSQQDPSLIPDPASDQLTPAMRQYAEQKAAVPDALLLFRMGDFYEMFYEDAVTASRALGLTLTTRGKDRCRVVRLTKCPALKYVRVRRVRKRSSQTGECAATGSAGVAAASSADPHHVF